MITVSAQVEGDDWVVSQLEAKSKETGESCSVAVGYMMPYAIYVHENLMSRHTNGQAKYLEEPLRRLGPSLIKITGDLLKIGTKMDKALLQTGGILLRASQALVPIKTGALRNSGFVELDKHTPPNAPTPADSSPPALGKHMDIINP
jgi:hypothetical protein